MTCIIQDITIHLQIVFPFIIYIYNLYIVLCYLKSPSNLGNVHNMSRTRNYSNNIHLTNVGSNIHLQLQPTQTFRKLNFHNKILSSNNLRLNTDVQEHTYIQLQNQNNNNNLHNNHNSSYSSLSQKTSSPNKINNNNNLKIVNTQQSYIKTNNLKYTKHHTKKSITKDTTSFSSYSNTNTTNTKHRYSSNNSEKIDTPEDLHFLYVHIIQNGKELENNF